MTHRSFAVRFAAFGTAMALIAACGSTTAATTTTAATAPPVSTLPGTNGVAAGPAGDAFYAPPSPLPAGKPGELIWAISIDSADPAVNGYKILYHSTSVSGADLAVSGLLWVPKTLASGSPVLSYAHGTTGLGDQCAPSKKNGAGEAASVAATFVKQGFIVTATDYEGLGTPGVHPYVVGVSEGHGVLDAIRAARNFTKTTGHSVVWGHSQGGGAALFAAELAPKYAPDTDVVGSVAGAPAVELKLLSAALKTSPFFGYVFMAAAGYKAAYPDVDLSKVFTANGLAEVDVAANGCSQASNDVRGKNPADYILADPSKVEPFATALETNTPGNVPTTVPIFVYQGEKDEQIPVVASLLYLKRACKTGGFTILRTTYPNQTHAGVIAKATPDIEQYIADRLAGKPAPTTPCPTA